MSQRRSLHAGSARCRSRRRSSRRAPTRPRHENAVGLRATSWRTRRATGWSIPIPGLCTSRPVLPAPALHLACAEETSDDRAVVWSLRISPDASVFEVCQPSDWGRLVGIAPLDVTMSRSGDWRRWTGPEGPLYLPVWRVVAAPFNGVHVTVGCYLVSRALRRPSPTAGACLPAGIPTPGASCPRPPLARSPRHHEEALASCRWRERCSAGRRATHRPTTTGSQATPPGPLPLAEAPPQRLRGAGRTPPRSPGASHLGIWVRSRPGSGMAPPPSRERASSRNRQPRASK